jgi:hypothetical protein
MRARLGVVGIQVHTSNFNTASSRFSDLRLYLITVHERFLTERREDDLTHLILGCHQQKRTGFLLAYGIQNRLCRL